LLQGQLFFSILLEILRTKCGLKGEEEKEDWGKLHSEDLHNLCPLPYIISMIRGGMMGLEGWAECNICERKNA
jgi:hypothetical protein